MYLVRNYEKSRVLPICLVLLDAGSYKHSKEDAFSLEFYVGTELNKRYVGIDEVSGLRELQEMDNLDNCVVYLKQSELRKQEDIKSIVEYCLHCRVVLLPPSHLDESGRALSSPRRMVLFP